MDDLLSADQARAITTEAESLLGEIARTKTKAVLVKVQDAARHGKRSITVDALDPLVEIHLRKLGYQTKTTYDQRDGNFATVTW